jgi:hypothetical protein
MTTLEGLGTLGHLGQADEFDIDDMASAEVEADTDWVKLVGDIVKAASPIAVEAAKGAFAQSKAAQGFSQSRIGMLLGLGQQRAAAVQQGSAPMPTAGWLGIGVAAVAVLGLIIVLAMRK